MPLKSLSFIRKNLLLAVGLTTIAVTPYLTYDPFNPVKLLIVAYFSGTALLLLLQNTKSIYKDNKLILIANGLFLAGLAISILMTDENKVATFFGISGRYTGVFFYTCLVILYLATSISADLKFSVNINYILMICGALTILYSWYQILGLDSAPWVQSTWVMSFFGNPNFTSSFLGIACGAYFNSSINNQYPNKIKFIFATGALISVITIIKTGSLQGLIVSAVVIFTALVVIIRNISKLNKLQVPFISLGVLISIWAVLDMLQKTPGKHYLYKASVSARGDYWRAAVGIIKNNPLFGQGMDSFRNNAPLYRDARQLTRGEGGMLLEATHNVFLDILVGGGIFLLASYLLIIFLSIRAAFRVIRRSEKLNSSFIVLFSSYIGYLLQSLISINQIGLAVWGWILGGSLVGYEYYSRDQQQVGQQNKGGKASRNNPNLNRSTNYLAIISGLLLAAVVFPIYKNSANIISAFDEKNPVKATAAVLSWPKDVINMSYVAERLHGSGLYPEGLALARQAAEFDKKSVVPLKVMTLFPQLSLEEREALKKKIHKLDPLYKPE